MLDKVRKYIQLNNLLENGEAAVVGVSGGADSICLLSVLLELGVKVYVVHVNHCLRGLAADKDMAYVEEFCKARGVECHTFSYDIEKIAREKKISCEEAGRLVRYEAFYKVMEQVDAKKIAVAHNAGDNAETILHNLFRGTGVKGLAGIPAKRGEIIRPLLCVNRKEIEGYLRERQIEYCEDATNFQDIYTRNKIRNKVIPYITENINLNATEHINAAGRMLCDIDEYISKEGIQLFEKTAVCDKEGVSLDVQQFTKLHNVMKAFIVRRAIVMLAESLKDISYTHIESVITLFDNEVGKKINLPYGIIAKKDYTKVRLYKEPENSEENSSEPWVKIRTFGEFFLGENGKKLVVSRFSKEEWNNRSDKYEEKIYTKWLDCDILGRNLVIRTRKTGDYIVVDDKGSRKKLKDLFIDIKLPKEERDKVLLLADGNEILWIVGHRINYNCRITEETKDIIMVEYRE